MTQVAAAALPHHAERSDACGGSTSTGPQRDGAVRIDVCVKCGWANRAVSHLLQRADATPVPVDITPGAELQTPPSAALVYDLNPWDRTAVEWLAERADEGESTPVLYYLPPTGAAFATLEAVPKGRDMYLQIQCRDGESLRHLKHAARALVRSVPRMRIMDALAASLPHPSSSTFLFGHRALVMLAAGQRPTVESVARGLGLSARSLQRRLAADGLVGPKPLLDWLTFAHIHVVAASRQCTPAKSAAQSGLTGNDLYRLRKRVRGLCAQEGTPLRAAGETLAIHPVPHVSPSGLGPDLRLRRRSPPLLRARQSICNPRRGGLA